MKFTLVSEGSSDQALIPIITWALRTAGVDAELESRWADFRGLPIRPSGLAEKIDLANEIFPCDVLFIHRDSDTNPREDRFEEITRAVGPLHLSVPHVCVIPVKMLEAWLVLDEDALRFAAGNPNGRVRLQLPPANSVERIADPKNLLFQLLRDASELSGRRLRKFKENSARSLICEYIDDFSHLRTLDSFRAFEADVQAFVATWKVV
jgi:hypothetical protein